ncbi:MAG: TlyA family RNA methyltransferase [Candidatus Syntrophonatronum acetioxidans]|uniref:TlyA family RNA methyltransferase n=1 Tax=Candidatus Syntrophonatronum acetioxidans TaxID=1795816 RepID=A0A424YFB6_9FIRM|nr:MAG: TlyA family RNA methyltransferase [Candidatus Syntrophonatronum acetioxidans]
MKERLDFLLVKRGICETRSRAKALILAGKVLVKDRVMDKAGSLVEEDAPISIKEDLPYVSRGGLKLARALEEFSLDLEGKVVLDVGASTGGFTDCALRHGAKKVYALDVGYGQLAWELRKDPRVVNMERVNIRHLKEEELEETPDLATVDVAFISLGHVFPVLSRINAGEVIALIKPQFEAGREEVGKKGVVRDPRIHAKVIEKVVERGLAEGYLLKNLTHSPVKGPQGNIEYLVYFVKEGSTRDKGEVPGPKGLIESVVNKAHRDL